MQVKPFSLKYKEIHCSIRTSQVHKLDSAPLHLVFEMSKEVITPVDIHYTAIHIPVSKHCKCHIRHFLHCSESVECDFFIDAVIALLGAGAVPWSFDKSRCNGIHSNALRLKLFYKRFGQEMAAAP